MKIKRETEIVFLSKSNENLSKEQKMHLARTTTDPDRIKNLINDSDPEVRSALSENVSIYRGGDSYMEGEYIESSGRRGVQKEGIFESGEWLLYLPALTIALIISWLTGDFKLLGF